MAEKRAREDDASGTETTKLLKAASLFNQWASLNESLIEKTYIEWLSDSADIDNKNLMKETNSLDEEKKIFNLLWRPFTLPYLTMGYAFEFKPSDVSKAFCYPKDGVNLWGRFCLINKVVKQLEEEKDALPAP